MNDAATLTAAELGSVVHYVDDTAPHRYRCRAAIVTDVPALGTLDLYVLDRHTATHRHNVGHDPGGSNPDLGAECPRGSGHHYPPRTWHDHYDRAAASQRNDT